MQGHRARQHKFNVGEAVLLNVNRRERKGETPSNHTFLHNHKDYWFLQFRLAEQMTRRQYAETHQKFKLLRTNDFQEKTRNEKTTIIPAVPPPTYQETQPAVTQDTITQRTPAVTTPTTQTQPLRRSQRQTKSTFDGHLKDYSA
ncbi:hypothetical protein OS493_033454 [Desmophyllum pertusum]|uniref:Uncharacterized protein n=1 Tax=Desmophyllum pertusum TaxID=174260 RepID=A0A9X0D700_9CNID|nr:hypothetical protein OS493_033454 [Desmophyllum pertusum]